MKDKKEFYSTLQQIDGRRFSEYSKLVGDFDFARYVLKIHPLQERGTPTLFVLRVSQKIASFPPQVFSTPVRRTALEDFLTRKVARAIDGLGRPGDTGFTHRHLSLPRPGQTILPRTSLIVTEESVEARIYVHLAQNGGRIDAAAATQIFFEDLPAVVSEALLFCNLDQKEVARAVKIMEDAEQVRQLLSTRGLISFIGENAMIDRSAEGDRPDYNSLRQVRAAEELLREMEVPNAGRLRGVGIPGGLTVVLGGEYSGRRELLQAIAAGIYNHPPGDGREFVITVPDAVEVSAQPGRSVQRVDISPFVPCDPDGGDASVFSTAAADACCAQAASTMEAIEAGSQVLLFDEADSSPAFLAGDARVAALLGESAGGTVSLAARARELVDDLGLSLVVAGSGGVAEFLALADTVLKVEGMVISDVTAQVKSMQGEGVAPARALPPPLSAVASKSRWVVPSSIDPTRGVKDDHIHMKSAHQMEFGRSLIDLSGLTQVTDSQQAATIGQILYYIKLHYLDQGRPLREILDLVDRDLSNEGLETLTRTLRGDLARPRRFEIAAALNRLETLRISHAGS